MPDKLLKPGLNFLEIAHDPDCPGRYENGRGCCCNPEVRLHTDEARFIRDASEQAREGALRFLVDAAWLTPIVEARQYAGRPASFAVSSLVATKFAAKGEALRDRRAAVRELFAP